MIFDDPKTRRPAHGHVEQKGGELAVAQFLAVSRRYFDLPPKHAVYRLAATSGAREPAASHFASSQRRRRPLSYRSFVSSVLFASTLGLGFVSPAFADPDCGFFGEMGRQRAERMEQHHQKLHDALKLAPEQEGAWKKLLASEHPVAKAEPAAREDWTKLTAPERAEKMLERMQAHQARMTEHVAALKEFYAALTPAQQKTFDDFHAGPRLRGKPGTHSPGAAAPPPKS